MNAKLKEFIVEYQKFINKFESKVKEIDKIEDENKKGTILLKFLIEELKEKANFYKYLNEIYKELKEYKQSHKNIWDAIKTLIETLEENKTPLQRYYELQNIKLPLKELEKLLNPISIEKELDRETIREIRQEFRNKRIKELAELKKVEIENKEKIISKYNELIKEEDGFLKSLTSKRVYLFYFNHNLEAFGEKDLRLINSLINSYIQQKINVNIDDIYPVFNKAIVKKGINKTDEPSNSIDNFQKSEILEAILNKFLYEAEEKRKDKEVKELILNKKNPDTLFLEYGRNKYPSNVLNKSIIKIFNTPEIWEETENEAKITLSKNSNYEFEVRINKNIIKELINENINVKDYIGLEGLDFYSLIQLALLNLNPAVFSINDLIKWKGVKGKVDKEQKEKYQIILAMALSLEFNIKKVKFARLDKEKYDEVVNVRQKLFNIETVAYDNAGKILKAYITPTKFFQEYYSNFKLRPYTSLYQKLIEYHSIKEKYEKAIGHELIYIFRENTNKKEITKVLGNLLEDVGLFPLKEKPSRIKEKIEKALNKLKEDGIIENWYWQEEYKIYGFNSKREMNKAKIKQVKESNLLNARLTIEPPLEIQEDFEKIATKRKK